MPGDGFCHDEASLIACASSGEDWDFVDCTESEFCVSGTCVECVTDGDCVDDRVCDDGRCASPPLYILTSSLAAATVSQDYEAELAAEGGRAPYEWHLVDGDLPKGLDLLKEGIITGIPVEAGVFTMVALVEDDEGSSAEDTFWLVSEAMPNEMGISTQSKLDPAEVGIPYSVVLTAEGGDEPYFFALSSGTLPAGVGMTSDGQLQGIPTAHGSYYFEVRAFDAADPMHSAMKGFVVNVAPAPLQAVSDETHDLVITTVNVLPPTPVVEGSPIPYYHEMAAAGGVTPYTWSEVPLPEFLLSTLSVGGLPPGLVLEDDGTLHGAVASAAEAVIVKIPFTDFSLAGFFFMIELSDNAPNAPQTVQVVYVVPAILL